MHGYQVFGEIPVDEGAGARIHDGLFEEGVTHPEGHAADQLGAGGFGIQEAAGGKDAEHAAEADLSRVGVDTDFREVGPVAVDRVGFVVRILLHADDLTLRLQTLRMVASDDPGQRLGCVANDHATTRKHGCLGIPAVQGRARIVARGDQQFPAQGIAGAMDGHAGVGSAPGSARTHTERKLGTSEFNAHAIERQPELLGGDLRQDGVGAAADVGHVRLDDGDTIRL